MANEKILFPVFEVPGMIEESDRYDVTYKKSVLWDFETGDFVRNGANRMVVCDGIESFRTWCVKIAQTERFRCLAYSSDIGVEMEEALKEPDERAVESAVERTIQEAIMVNPRTEYVRNFEFYWEKDNMYVSFVVKGINWNEEIKIEVGEEVL